MGYVNKGKATYPMISSSSGTAPPMTDAAVKPIWTARAETFWICIVAVWSGLVVWVGEVVMVY